MKELTMQTPNKPKPSYYSDTQWVDKTYADELLAKSPHNIRPWSRARVEKYKRALIEDRWEDNAEPVQILLDGSVGNGRHRLIAISETGVGVWLNMVFDVPSVQHVDTGKPRSVGDYLRQLGFKDVFVLSSVAKASIKYRLGLLPNAQLSPDVEETTNYVEEHADSLPLSVKAARSAQGPVTPTVLGFAHHLGWLTSGSKYEADEFIEVIRSGMPEYEGDAAFALRETMIREKMGSSKRKTSTVDRFAMAIRAWNLRLDKKSTKRIVRRQEASKRWTWDTFPKFKLLVAESKIKL